MWNMLFILSVEYVIFINGGCCKLFMWMMDVVGCCFESEIGP